MDRGFYKLFGKKIEKGDIVVAVQPIDPKTFICKRVIQTGGNYLPDHPSLKVPVGSYWLEGDNKKHSYDSRHHGCVPEHLVMGKIVHVFTL